MLPAPPALTRARRFALPGTLLGTALAALLGLSVLPAPDVAPRLVAQSALPTGARSLTTLTADLAPAPAPVRVLTPVATPTPTPRLTAAPRVTKQRASRSRAVAEIAPVEQISTDGYVCPVAGKTHFTDTWGESRSGGRHHQGTDMMAAYGTPLAAVTAGTVRSAYSSAGGTSIYLQGDDGVEYFYAHNSRNSISNGERVKAGDIIGAVGTSGNAPKSAPHLHFERHPGRSPVNPYPFVRRVC